MTNTYSFKKWMEEISINEKEVMMLEFVNSNSDQWLNFIEEKYEKWCEESLDKQYGDAELDKRTTRNETVFK
jgi:hypothetical protein